MWRETKYVKLLSNVAFNFDLRRYAKDQSSAALALFDFERASLDVMLVEADFGHLDAEVIEVLVRATTSDDPRDLLSARFAPAELEKLFEKLHQRASGCYGDEDLRTAASLNSLASVYRNQKWYEEALDLYERALDVKLKVLGEEHPDVASTLNGMANVYQMQGRYEEALDLYERALDVELKVLGEEHPDVASTLNGMANVYLMQGRYEEALEFYERALAMEQKALGEEHPGVAPTLNNMAVVYQKQGCYE